VCVLLCTACCTVSTVCAAALVRLLVQPCGVAGLRASDKLQERQTFADGLQQRHSICCSKDIAYVAATHTIGCNTDTPLHMSQRHAM